jgi:hypothetical protein
VLTKEKVLQLIQQINGSRAYGLIDIAAGLELSRSITNELTVERREAPAPVRTRHSHYHKMVAGLDFVDVYRVLLLFNVTDPCLQHAIKKLLVAGGRGAGKDISRDIQEAMDSLARWQEMRAEEPAAPLSTLEPLQKV